MILELCNDLFGMKRYVDTSSPLLIEHDSNTLFYFMLYGRISRNIGENIFGSYIGTTSENIDFMFLLPRLIACASQPDGNMTSFTLHFPRLTKYCNCVAMQKGYATGNNGKELYWILISVSKKGLKA